MSTIRPADAVFVKQLAADIYVKIVLNPEERNGLNLWPEGAAMQAIEQAVAFVEMWTEATTPTPQD